MIFNGSDFKNTIDKFNIISHKKNTFKKCFLMSDKYFYVKNIIVRL